MKRLTALVLGLWGAIALPAIGFAQSGSNAPANEEGTQPVVETRSELLLTEPISLDTSGQTTNSSARFGIYDATRLKEVTESLRVKPGSGGKILDFIPPDLIHAPSSPTMDNRAIDFFQVPPPDPSVGINLNTQ
jgi:hypothetical protein